MASFDYRLNPLYPIKECSSCRALYTTKYCCFDGSPGDKIICDLDKTPDLSQRPPQNCPKCGNPVDGHYCQGCALLRKKFTEDMFTYCIENGILQDSSKPSNDNTNVANALQEPFDRPTIYYDDDDEDYAIAVIPSLSTEKPDNSLSMRDEHLDTVPVTELDEFIKSSVQSLFVLALLFSEVGVIHYILNEKGGPKEDECIMSYQSQGVSVWEGAKVIHLQAEYSSRSPKIFSRILESEGIPDNMCDVPFHNNYPPLDVSKDQFEDFFDSNNGSTSTDDDSFSIDNIEYVEALPSDSELISLEVMEIVISEVGGIDDDILLTIKDDILRENLLNVNLLIANIEALNDNPTPSFDFMTKSSFTSLNSPLEETNTCDNSLPESETFCIDLEEISSGSTTTHSDISLLEYEAFYDDHVKEISNASTTTHSDSSLCDSFIFDLLINPFPSADRSDFYEFADELAHIISPPEYDCFFFKNEPNSGDFIMDVVEDIFPTREPRVHVHNALPTHPTIQLNLDFILSSESLFAYVIAKLTHVVNQQTSAVTTAMTAILKQFQETPPPAPVKAVEEICVTYGGAHPYYQCLAAGGNTFPEFRDNIQGYVSAAAGNMKAMQTQIDMVKNELRNEIKTSIQTSLSNQTNEIKNMMASLLQMNTASTLGSRSLRSNIVANPKGELKAITTRSGLVTDGPTVPTPPKSITTEVNECVEETYTDPDLAEYTIKVPPPPV
uniref:Reverse transcriptase domain-containing protein n=1 Tax=Tanacetum cinerariifolium TaxID=118510 RepID=A0A6L2M0Q4_TANCI|nr:hypothetical protein [Tanacetum cinerariifolium]